MIGPVPTSMAQEIASQPDTLAATLAAAEDARPELRRLAPGVERVLFFGRGSSANAAAYGQHLCESLAATPAEIGAPSTATLYRAAMDLSSTLVVVLSQSGRTEELVAVAGWARRRGARTVGVTNDPASPLAESVDVVLPVAAGTERAVPATKTYTGQLAAIAVLVSSVRPAAATLADGLGDVPDQARAMLRCAPDAERVAASLVGSSGLVVTGRGPTLTTALELALKVQETCRLAAVPLSAADLQHGPIALLGDGVPLIATAAPGPTTPSLVAVARTAHERGARVVVLGGDGELLRHADEALPGPRLPVPLVPVVGVIAGQLVVESLARGRGLDPDGPAGLTKVTQTA